MSNSPTNARSNIVLLDGSKNFWKTRNYLKILIINHAEHDCLEIISFDPADGIEQPRIYVDKTLIFSKLDKEIVEQTYLKKKEALNRQKRSKDREELLNDIKTDMMVQFTLGRINVKLTDEKGGFSVYLQPSFDDVTVEGDDGNTRIDVERIIPVDLVPYTDFVKTIAKSKVDEFRTTHNEMTQDKALASAELNKATQSSSLASKAISGFVGAFRRKSIFNMKIKLCSFARQRWMKAIHKVIVQNYVEAVRRRIAYLEDLVAGRIPTETLIRAAVERVQGATRGLVGKKKSFCDEHMGLSSKVKFPAFNTGLASPSMDVGDYVRSRRGSTSRGSFDDSHIMENFMRLAGASVSRDERDATTTSALPPLSGMRRNVSSSVRLASFDENGLYGDYIEGTSSRRPSPLNIPCDTKDENDEDFCLDDGQTAVANANSLSSCVSNSYAGYRKTANKSADTSTSPDKVSPSSISASLSPTSEGHTNTNSTKIHTPSGKILTPIYLKTTAAQEARKQDNPFAAGAGATTPPRKVRSNAGNNSRPGSVVNNNSRPGSAANNTTSRHRRSSNGGTVTPADALSCNASPSPTPSHHVSPVPTPSPSARLSPLPLDSLSIRTKSSPMTSPLPSPLPSARAGYPLSRRPSGAQLGGLGGIASGSMDPADDGNGKSFKEHAGHIPGMRMVKRVGSFRHTSFAEGSQKAPLTRASTIASSVNGSGSGGGGSSRVAKIRALRKLTLSTDSAATDGEDNGDANANGNGCGCPDSVDDFGDEPDEFSGLKSPGIASRSSSRFNMHVFYDEDDGN